MTRHELSIIARRNAIAPIEGVLLWLNDEVDSWSSYPEAFQGLGAVLQLLLEQLRYLEDSWGRELQADDGADTPDQVRHLDAMRKYVEDVRKARASLEDAQRLLERGDMGGTRDAICTAKRIVLMAG
jgi:hypothetical protein